MSSTRICTPHPVTGTQTNQDLCPVQCKQSRPRSKDKLMLWILLLIQGLLLAQTRVVCAADVNIALGHPCSFNPAPNDATCTDAGDASELTDGVMLKQAKQMWTDKRSVGWLNVRKPISITVDLGKDQPISGVGFGAAAGSAGVMFPRSLALSVSTDGKAFETVGDLAAMDQTATPLYGRYAYHIFQTHALRTHGRYVRLSIIAAGQFVYCDEIQVYRGNDALLNQPIEGQPLSETALVDPLRLTRLGVHRRVKDDWALVHAAAEHLSAGALREQLLRQLAVLRKEIDQMVSPSSLEGFRAVIPINDLDARVFSIYGQIMAARGVKPITVWHSSPYQLLSLLETPDQSPFPSIKVRMLGNEHRAEVFNVSNASAEPRTLSFTLEGLPDGVVRISQVDYVDTAAGRPVASALTPLPVKDGQYTATVAAGMTRQFWLSFDSSKVAAGTYDGRIHLLDDASIPVTLSVASIRMPPHLELNTFMWDEIINQSYGITATNMLAARQDMINHDINAVWCTPASTPMPLPRDFDAQGNLVGKIDYAKWDEFVKFWPGMRHYFAFPAFKEDEAAFAGMKLGTAQCDRALSQWAGDWARHNRQLGLKPRQAAILFIDEPRNPVAYHTSYLFLKPFKAGSDEILTYCDPFIRNMKEFEQARPMLDFLDVIQPTQSVYDSVAADVHAAYRQLQQQGKQLWLYSCSGPTRQFDPSYFRMQPWDCFASGATGSAFWSYGDNGGASSWNPYTSIGRTSYTPIYLAPDSVGDSKHWQAVREGIEDYQYLYMLERQRGSEEARKLAQRVMHQLVERDSPNYALAWTNGSQFAEEARLEILNLLRQ